MRLDYVHSLTGYNPTITQRRVFHLTAATIRNKELYEQTVKNLSNYGTYLWGRGVAPYKDLKSWPSECVEKERVHKSTLSNTFVGYTQNINFFDRTSIEHFANNIIIETLNRDRPHIQIDGIVHPTAGGEGIPWEVYCYFLSLIRNGIAPRKVYANVAGSPWIFTAQDIHLLAQAVNGVSFEDPLNRHWCTPHVHRVLTEIENYALMIKNNLHVLFVPQVQVKEICAGVSLLVDDDGNSAHTSLEYWRPEASWVNWRADLGDPVEEYKRVGNTIQRKFTNGSIVVDHLNNTAWLQ